jgi:hypothetical protein
VTPDVVRAVYEATRGQPGLVCWYGELLTTTYNPGPGQVIDGLVWSRTITLALFAPVQDETVLARLSGTQEKKGVWVTVRAIGWV